MHTCLSDVPNGTLERRMSSNRDGQPHERKLGVLRTCQWSACPGNNQLTVSIKPVKLVFFVSAKPLQWKRGSASGYRRMHLSCPSRKHCSDLCHAHSALGHAVDLLDVPPLHEGTSCPAESAPSRHTHTPHRPQEMRFTEYDAERYQSNEVEHENRGWCQHFSGYTVVTRDQEERWRSPYNARFVGAVRSRMCGKPSKGTCTCHNHSNT